MKKLLTFITLAAAALTASAGTAAADTIVVTESGQWIEGRDTLAVSRTVSVSRSAEADNECYDYCESDFNFDFPFARQRCPRQYDRFTFGIGLDCRIGFVGTANADVNPRYSMGRSWEAAFDRLAAFTYRPFRNGPRMSVGFGIETKRLTSTSGRMFVKEGDEYANAVGVGSAPAGASDIKARLDVFSLLVPFTVSQHLTSDVKFSLSAVMNIPTSMRVENKYKLDGQEIDVKWKTNAVRPINWDFKAVLSYDGWGWYVKYSPYSLFRDGCGPRTTTISTGLALTW